MDKVLKRDSLEYTTERERFLKELYQFHCNRGTPYHKLPHVQGKTTDLYLLYSLVSAAGGYNKVNENDKWDDFAELFHIPKGCANGAQALKCIYHRYLYLYERMHLFGDDPDHADDGDEFDEPGTSAMAALQRRQDRTFVSGGVPLIYNYRQHHVDYNQRQFSGMSTGFARPNQYAKLEKSLLCGLPNEVDFAFNVCTMLSAEGNHTLRLLTHPRLLDLLLAHVGIFCEGSTLGPLYDGVWSTALSRDFVKFWRHSTEDAELLDRMELPGFDKSFRSIPLRSNVEQRGDPSSVDADGAAAAAVLSMGAECGLRKVEGLRVQQVAAILRNLSFDGCNARVLAASAGAIRFVLLCSSSKYPSLRHDGLETFANLATRLVLKPLPDELTQLVFWAVHKCLSSGDKFQIVNGLEIISNLARVEANEDTLSDNLDLMTYDSVAASMKIKDIQLIASALDALYHLSELGDRTCDKIAHTAHCIDMLASLVTVEAHSFGDEAVKGIRVVDETPYHLLPPDRQMLAVPQRLPPQPTLPHSVPPYRPPLGAVAPASVASSAGRGGGSNGGGSGGSMQPTQPHPMGTTPPDAALNAGMAVAPAALSQEAIACNWLRVNFEPCPDSTVSTASMLSDFMVWLQKKNLPGLQGAQQFINFVKYVFPSSDCIRRSAGPGSTAGDLIHVGLRRREAPGVAVAPGPQPPGAIAASPSRPSTPHQAPASSQAHGYPAMAGLLCNGVAPPPPPTMPQQPTQMMLSAAAANCPTTAAAAGWSGLPVSPLVQQPLPPPPDPYAGSSGPGARPVHTPPFLPSVTDVANRSSPVPAVGSASSALKNLLQSRLLQNHDLGLPPGPATSKRGSFIFFPRANASSHALAVSGMGSASMYGPTAAPLVGDWLQPPAAQQQPMQHSQPKSQFYGNGPVAPGAAAPTPCATGIGCGSVTVPSPAIGAELPQTVSPPPLPFVGPSSPKGAATPSSCRSGGRSSSRHGSRGAAVPGATGFHAAAAPRMLELQICGEAEKAGDINIAAAEAKIERVENVGARDEDACSSSERSAAPSRQAAPGVAPSASVCTTSVVAASADPPQSSEQAVDPAVAAIAATPAAIAATVQAVPSLTIGPPRSPVQSGDAAVAAVPACPDDIPAFSEPAAAATAVVCNGYASAPCESDPVVSKSCGSKVDSLAASGGGKPCQNGSGDSSCDGTAVAAVLLPSPVVNGHHASDDRRASDASPDSSRPECSSSDRCDDSCDGSSAESANGAAGHGSGGSSSSSSSGGGSTVRKWSTAGGIDCDRLLHVNGLVNGIGSPQGGSGNCDKLPPRPSRLLCAGNGGSGCDVSSELPSAVESSVSVGAGDHDRLSGDVKADATTNAGREPEQPSDAAAAAADSRCCSEPPSEGPCSIAGAEKSEPCPMEVDCATEAASNSDNPVRHECGPSHLSPPPEKRLRTASVDSEQSSSSTLSSATTATSSHQVSLSSCQQQQQQASQQHRQHDEAQGPAPPDTETLAPPPPATTPAAAPTNAFICEWASCGRILPENAAPAVRLHVLEEHLRQAAADGSCCLWEACDGLRRQRWSLVSHVLDKHCTEAALRAAALRRQQEAQARSAMASSPSSSSSPSLQHHQLLPAPPPPVYGTDAARQAIMRNVDRPPFAELLDSREGPVTKHFRYTSALILRNVARYSAFGLSILKKHESTLTYVALSSQESAAVASGCLFEMHRQQLQPQL